MNLGLGNTKIASLSVAVEREMASFCAEAAAAGLLSAPRVYQSQGCYQFSESCCPEWEQPVDSVHPGIFAGKVASESM